MSQFDTYKTPLDSRYSSDDMKRLFGAKNRHGVWRRLWLYLAMAQKANGIGGISDEALRQMEEHLVIQDEEFAIVAVEEKRRRHDVMAHVHAFGIVAPAAAPIIHFGATSCFVTDNTELILMRDAVDLLLPKLAKVIYNLKSFALQTKDIPTLAYTHHQPAQLITVGRRISQWIQDLLRDLDNIEIQRRSLKFRGAMGTTGTQASFLEIFHGDTGKIDRLNKILCEKAGFPNTYDISVQTYSRKVDLDIANAVCGIASTAMHITNDIRHLAHVKEVEEPFERDQIGSSAMAYKQRICALSRKLRSLPVNFADTYSDQWFERTLDDSAIRRIDIPEMFLLADAVLTGLDNVTSGLVIYEKKILSRVMEELPFMASENIIMKMVGHGSSRQDAHEEIRVLSRQASDVVKNKGGKNDLLDRIRATEFFRPIWSELDSVMDPNLYIGRSAEMVERFCTGPVEEKLQPYRDHITKSGTAQLNV